MPLFVFMVAGFTLRRINFFNGQFISNLNKTAFTCFIPVLLFDNIYHTSLDDIFHVRVTIFALAAIIAIWIITFLLTGLMNICGPARGAIIQGIYRANFVLYGLPVIILLYGPGRAGVTSMLAAITVPFFNILAIITLTIFGQEKATIKNCLIDIAKNPLIIGSFLGVVVLLSGLKIPTFLETSITWTSNMAIPLSLIVMGASLEISAFKEKYKLILVSSLIRLLVVPLVVLTVAAMMNFRNIDMATLVAIFAAPTAVTSFPMALQMKADGDVACGIIIITTIFSVLTMFLSLLIMQCLGFIVIP